MKKQKKNQSIIGEKMIEKIMKEKEVLKVYLQAEEELACGFGKKMIGKTLEEEIQSYLSENKIDWTNRPISLIVEGHKIGTILWKK